MKWFDNFINRPLTTIFRLDKDEHYEYYQPIGIFIMFDKENGFLMSALNDGISINLEAVTFSEACNYQGVEFNDTFIQEVKPGDKLYNFIGQSLKIIKVGVYDDSELSGDNFIIKQGKYAGITVASDGNKFTFYNNYGGWI